MTDPLFFDTDCLSAFLWVNNQSLLAMLYPGRIVIPAEVYSELSNPAVKHLRDRIDTMLSKGHAVIESIPTDSPEYRLFIKMSADPDKGHIIIGRGEAAAITLAKSHGGILASNNLRDIAGYVKEFHLEYRTTGAILKEALLAGLITEDSGNQLWQSMLRKRRKLGYDSFSDYLQDNNDK